MIVTTFVPSIYITNYLLQFYYKYSNMTYVFKVFDRMPQRDIISWNTILFGFAGIRNTKFAQYLVDSMPERDVRSHLGFDEISLSSALIACASIKGQLDIIQLHGLTVICNSTFDICIANAILDMYGKCGGLVEACLIFDEMEKRDVISWNAIIVAHEQNEEIEKILSFFVSMLRQIVEPDDSTYGSVVKACAGLQALKYGMDIHGQIVNSGLESESFLGNFIVDMYCKCGMLEEVEKIHYRLDGQTMVLWNSMISRFSLQK
ncbi:hypothetical protein HN51_050601 [Arachis hypogaea]